MPAGASGDPAAALLASSTPQQFSACGGAGHEGLAVVSSSSLAEDEGVALLFSVYDHDEGDGEDDFLGQAMLYLSALQTTSASDPGGASPWLPVRLPLRATPVVRGLSASHSRVEDDEANEDWRRRSLLEAEGADEEDH